MFLSLTFFSIILAPTTHVYSLEKDNCPSDTSVSSKTNCIRHLLSSFDTVDLNGDATDENDPFYLKYTFEVTGLSGGSGEGN